MAANPEEHIRRVRIGRPDDEQRETWRDLWSWVGKIEDAAEAGDFPRNPDSCFRYGSECAYWPVCSGRAEITDEAFYVRAGKHVELRDEVDRTRTIEDMLDF